MELPKNDPYQPPNSELALNNDPMDYKSLRWKVLFFILLPLELWSQYDIFTVNEYNDTLVWRLFSSAIYALAFVAFFGLAFKKIILNSKFWFYYLVAYLLLDIYEIARIFMNTASEELILVYIVLGVLSPLILLAWYAVFKYARVLSKVERMDIG